MKYIYLLVALSFVTACSSNPQNRSGGNSCASDCKRQYSQSDKQKQCLNMCR